MNILLNYADELFVESQALNSRSGLTVGGFDQVLSFSPKDIDPDFRRANKAILRCSRGDGFWLWKPYFVRRVLRGMQAGDTLFYCDAGAYFVHCARPLLDLCSKSRDVVVFDLTLLERNWTKRDAFVLLDCDSPSFSESRQRLGGFHVWRKSSRSLALVEDWLDRARDPRLATDLENQCGQPNYPGFQEHRHDQSLLSLLTKKAGVEAFRDPSQWGNGEMADYPNSPYPQILESTRKRNAIGWMARIKRRLGRT